MAIKQLTEYVLDPHVWYHVVGIISVGNGGSHRYYVNGELIKEETNLGFTTIKTNNADKWIGRATSYFQGVIGMVRIYNCTLTESEIQNNYNNPNNPIKMENLVLWLKLDELSGSTAHDSSGNGNDGTIYGCNWVS
ncbi:MAG: LamG-like jellyroll fold domain-containing protein [Candidatus Jordarchaeum sp.]|uniref:LamG-like jellyroll fold domain-containing protein n=1 Tax=Candidatus Jordarchaeum sp. TaxID=2823881 RepID=UPI00404989A1